MFSSPSALYLNGWQENWPYRVKQGKEGKEMSKMSEMASAFEDLRRCAAAIADAADWLSEQFSRDEAAPEEAEAVKPAPDEPVPIQPSPAKAPVALEAVRAVLADKSRAGLTAQVRSLLLKHGADKLSGIDPAKYAALLADAEGL